MLRERGSIPRSAAMPWRRRTTREPAMHRATVHAARATASRARSASATHPAHAHHGPPHPPMPRCPRIPISAAPMPTAIPRTARGHLPRRCASERRRTHRLCASSPQRTSSYESPMPGMAAAPQRPMHHLPTMAPPPSPIRRWLEQAIGNHASGARGTNLSRDVRNCPLPVPRQEGAPMRCAPRSTARRPCIRHHHGEWHPLPLQTRLSGACGERMQPMHGPPAHRTGACAADDAPPMGRSWKS